MYIKYIPFAGICVKVLLFSVAKCKQRKTNLKNCRMQWTWLALKMMYVCHYKRLEDLLCIIQNQENLFICLAAVLNMGNIEFGEDDNEYSFVKDKNGPLTTTAVSIPA